MKTKKKKKFQLPKKKTQIKKKKTVANEEKEKIRSFSCYRRVRR